MDSRAAEFPRPQDQIRFRQEAECPKSTGAVLGTVSRHFLASTTCMPANGEFEKRYASACAEPRNHNVGIVLFGADRESMKARRQASPRHRRYAGRQGLLAASSMALGNPIDARPITADSAARRRQGARIIRVNRSTTPIGDGSQAIDPWIRAPRPAQLSSATSTGKTAIAPTPSSSEPLTTARTRTSSSMRPTPIRPTNAPPSLISEVARRACALNIHRGSRPRLRSGPDQYSRAIHRLHQCELFPATTAMHAVHHLGRLVQSRPSLTPDFAIACAAAGPRSLSWRRCSIHSRLSSAAAKLNKDRVRSLTALR